MSKTKILLSILAILFGVFMFVYGGYDDSPGGQLLGVLLVGAGVWIFVKNRRKD
jgi:LPXTG-motif cell wall-anchored protein